VVSHSDAIGLISVIGLFWINFKFNYDYGMLMASGSDSPEKFAMAFGLLESTALFLAGFTALRGHRDEDVKIAKYCLYFLLALSFWTCFSSILASDARAKWDGDQIEIHNTLDQIRDIDTQIDIVEGALRAHTPGFFAKVLNSATGYSVTGEPMEDLQDRLAALRDEKTKVSKHLRGETIDREQFAVFEKVGSMIGVSPDVIRMVSRLLFGFAVIASYCVAFRVLTAKVLYQSKK
jgi:hypothetical protein